MDKPINVLIPLDGSRHAERALPQGMRLAELLGCRAGAVQVVTPEEHDDRTVLVNAVADAGLDWSERVVDTDVARGIITAAVEHHAVVCMATRGHGRSVALIGSIPEEVVRRSSLPVMLIGPGVDVHASGPIRQLIVAVDGTQFGEEICAPACAWASEFGLKVHFLTVVQPSLESADHAKPSDRWFGPSGDVHAYMADLVSRHEVLATGVDGSVVYDPISPAGGLVQMLRRSPDAILALGTHGRTGMSRLVHGSTASKTVAETSAPVLMFPSHHDDAR
jgi:nucleotide-binding universal stress UspA family protein